MVKKYKGTRHWSHRAGRVAYGLGQSFMHGYGRSLSHTKTLVNTKTERLKGDDVHSGVTDVSYKIVVAPNKKNIDYRAAKNAFHELSGGRIAGPPGIQQTALIGTVGTTSQWLVSSGTGGQLFGSSKSAQSYLSLNPSQYGQGSTYYGSVFGQLATDKYYLSSCNVKMSIANMSTLPVSVWVYCLVSQTTHSRSPLSDWEIIEKELGLGKAVLAAPAAGTNNVGGTAGTADSKIANLNPFSNKTFRKFWKPLKVHRVNLAGAAQEDVDFHLKMNQLGDLGKIIVQNSAMDQTSATWTEANISQNYLRGSVAFLAVQRGAVVHDNTGGGGGITFGGNSVGYVVSKTYSFYPVQGKSSRFESKGAVMQIPFNATDANTKFIDIVDDISGVENA